MAKIPCRLLFLVSLAFFFLLCRAQVSGEDSYSAYLKGVTAAREGDFALAESYLKDASRLAPGSGEVWSELARVYLQESKFEEAVAAYTRAQSLNPENKENYYGLGLAYQEKGDLRTADDLYKKVVQADKDAKITELARTARREIAMQTLKSKGLRVDAVMYCLGALELLSSKPRNEIQLITSEIAFLGRRGLDINNPEKKYHLNSLTGDFTGLHLLCYMYVGFRILDEELDIGADLSSEYKAALRLFSKQIDE